MPNDEDKCISISKTIVNGDEDTYKNRIEIRYFDSFKFMASFTDNISKDLKTEQFREMSRVFDKDTNFLMRRGVYPYYNMDSFERFNEKELPPKEEFYSLMNYTNISDNDYEHAHKVWKQFDAKNLVEYHDIYLKANITLLADIFENFEDLCSEIYKLDSAWLYTSPRLRWSALLKKTEITLDLLSDADIKFSIENGIRVGVSMILNRYGKANSKHMENFTSNEESKYITYFRCK